MTEIVELYITKYALTNGIKKVRCRVEPDDNLAVQDGARYPLFTHSEGNEWHRTYEGALLKAETMRFKKIGSLNAQLKKMQGLTFKGPKS
jgi:hypothetical protein